MFLPPPNGHRALANTLLDDRIAQISLRSFAQGNPLIHWQPRILRPIWTQWP